MTQWVARVEFPRSEWPEEEEGALPKRSVSNKKEHPRGGAACASPAALPGHFQPCGKGQAKGGGEEPAAWEGQDRPWDHTWGQHEPPANPAVSPWRPGGDPAARNYTQVAGRDGQSLSQTLGTFSASNIWGEDLNYNNIFLIFETVDRAHPASQLSWKTQLPKSLSSKDLHTPPTLVPGAT